MSDRPATAERVTLVAPARGVLVPLEMVPDPVFAQKMVGDGISVDPLEGVLFAPADGEVVHLHPSAHALTLRTAEGLELLLHIGLDTVHLRGDGFTPLVRVGDGVKAGDQLITFDLDELATRAKSLLTQVVVTNMELVDRILPRTGSVAPGDVVAEIVLAVPAGSTDGAHGARQTAAETSGRKVTSQAVLVPNPEGLHARPAATLARQAQEFGGEVWLVKGKTQVNAKSIMAIMGLEVEFCAKVHIVASGVDAEQAAESLASAIASGLGEEGVSVLPPDTGAAVFDTETAAPVSTPPTPVSASPTPSGVGESRELKGAAASPGLAVGTIVQIRHEEAEVGEEAGDHHAERRRLNDAIDRALTQLWTLQNRLAQETGEEKAAIFAAHAEILRDPDLLDLATSSIDKGKSAPFAWRSAYTMYADRLAGLRSTVLAGRAVDVRDVGQRVLEELLGTRGKGPDLPPHSILVAEDLTPSDTASLDRSTVVGFVTTGGGASSHVAILARSLDIPAVAGIDARALALPDGTRAVIDGAAGTLRFDVTPEEIERIWNRQARRAERRAVELAHAGEPAVTRDGLRIEVVANIGGLDDARAAVEKGAEGIGLLRSEFLFLSRRTAPTEDEQALVYQQIAESLEPGSPLVIRTLDVGGDKPLSYLPIPPEENPFLGERGIRVGLARPELLRTQLRAILRAADCGARVHVMFPMVSTLEDYRAARAILDEERERLGVPEIPVGVMVEVPSVALTASQFAAEVDFFSVGTNDLTQYTLAMDRGHPKLAPQVDGLHPAVLSLIGRAAQAGREAGFWTGVCGGTAGDPQAVPLLLGLGVRELSVSVPVIPAVKAQIRTLDLAECQDLAARALTVDSAAAVRALVPSFDDEELS
ncbi:MAG: multiphosphoryl transfer protein [Actinomycetota bacterium]|nr:multiphosphoryl transfer protein [Actinomycetota bacterium]